MLIEENHSITDSSNANWVSVWMESWMHCSYIDVRFLFIVCSQRRSHLCIHLTTTLMHLNAQPRQTGNYAFVKSLFFPSTGQLEVCRDSFLTSISVHCRIHRPTVSYRDHIVYIHIILILRHVYVYKFSYKKICTLFIYKHCTKTSISKIWQNMFLLYIKHVATYFQSDICNTTNNKRVNHMPSMYYVWISAE